MASFAVREVYLYMTEPWDLLPIGCEEDGGVKFSFGLRINRATRIGYWKSTGRDKVVSDYLPSASIC